MGAPSYPPTGRPGPAVLSRISDSRVHQYWDPSHQLAKRLAAKARDPQPRQKCCIRDGFLWDLAALYPPGPTWNGTMPPATFFNGPVVKVKADLESALLRVPTLSARY
jgi:hypothetical protein